MPGVPLFLPPLSRGHGRQGEVVHRSVSVHRRAFRFFSPLSRVGILPQSCVRPGGIQRGARRSRSRGPSLHTVLVAAIAKRECVGQMSMLVWRVCALCVQIMPKKYVHLAYSLAYHTAGLSVSRSTQSHGPSRSDFTLVPTLTRSPTTKAPRHASSHPSTGCAFPCQQTHVSIC